MTIQVIAKNASQIQQKFDINARTVVQPTTWYTCPAGKRAVIKGQVNCTGRGAGATANVEFAGVQMYRWDRALVLDGYLVNPVNLADTQMAEFEVELAAGEIMETTQDVGTNAEFNVFASVLELPA